MDGKIGGALKTLGLVTLFAAPFTRVVVYSLPVYVFDVVLGYFFLSNWRKALDKILPLLVHLLLVLIVFQDYYLIYIYVRMILSLSLLVSSIGPVVKKALDIALLLSIATFAVEIFYSKAIWVFIYKIFFGIDVLDKERFFHDSGYDFRYIGLFLNSNIAAGAMVLQMIASHLIHGKSIRVAVYGVLIFATGSKLGIISFVFFCFYLFSGVLVVVLLIGGLLLLASGLIPFRDILSKEVYAEAVTSRLDNFIQYGESLLKLENIPFGRGFNYVASRLWIDDGSLVSSGPFIFLSYFGIYSYVILRSFWMEIIRMPLWILFLIFLLWISDNYIMVVPCFTSYIFLLCGLLSTTPTQSVR